MHVGNALIYYANFYANRDLEFHGHTVKAGEYVDRDALGMDENAARGLLMTNHLRVGPAPAQRRPPRGRKEEA